YTLAISFISSLHDMANAASVLIVLLFADMEYCFHLLKPPYQLDNSFSFLEVEWLAFHKILVSTLSNDMPSTSVILIMISISIPTSISFAITVSVATLIVTVPKSNVLVSFASF
nr:hypothetical protein [Tanacetum cinerariifolium]